METTLDLAKNKYLNEIWSELPAGIIDKKATGIGATHLELFDAKRNSIVVSPLVSILKSKADSSILTLYSEVNWDKEFELYFIPDREFVKIHVTAESLSRLSKKLRDVSRSFDMFHFVIDEIDLVQLQSDFREFLPIVFDFYKLFDRNNRTCLTATYYQFSDPDLKNERVTTLEVLNQRQRNIEAYTTNSTLNRVLDILASIKGQVLIFVDSLAWITSLISRLNETSIGIYCSSNSDDIKFYKPYTITPKERVCFLTSAYFVGCDFKFEEKPTVITVSDASINRALTKSQIIQIGGRVRTLIEREIFVATPADTNEAFISVDKLVSDAKRILDYFNTNFTSPEKNRAVMDSLRALDINNICLDLNNRPQINYALIDSKMIRQNDSKIYNSQQELISFVRTELNAKVTLVNVKYKKPIKVKYPRNTPKKTAFEKVCSEILQGWFNALNSSGQTSSYLKKYINDKKRKSKGNEKKYWSLVTPYNSLNFSNSNWSDLLKSHRTKQLELYANIFLNEIHAKQIPIESHFPIEGQFTFPELLKQMKGLLRLIELTELTKTLDNRSVRTYISSICQVEEIRKERKKGLKIIAHHDFNFED